MKLWPAAREVGIAERERRAFAPDTIARALEDAPRPPRSGEPGLPDSLVALKDALDDPAAYPHVRLCALALDAELITDTQRLLLAAFVYELADALNKAFA